MSKHVEIIKRALFNLICVENGQTPFFDYINTFLCLVLLSTDVSPCNLSANRKFADIEAANHRLASALYLKEGESHASSLSSHEQDAPISSGNPSQSDPLQGSEKPSVPTDVEGISKSKTDAGSRKAESRLKKHSDIGHFWENHDKYDCTTQTNNRRKRRQKKVEANKLSFISSPKDREYFQDAGLGRSEYYDQSQFEPVNDLSDDLQAPPNSSSARHFNHSETNSPSFSSELSPLSLDSYDFSVQMFTDLTGCAQDQKTTTEGQLTSMVDLFSAGEAFSESCMDVGDYFDRNCSCQDKNALEVCADNVPGVEYLHSERGELRYHYSCQEEQRASTDHIDDNQRSTLVLRRNVNNAKPSQSMDINSNLLSTSIDCSYDVTQLQTQELLQEGILFNDLNLTPFEGVAQSFSAPPHPRVHRPIPTPPPDDDWLFRDILKDRRSPY